MDSPTGIKHDSIMGALMKEDSCVGIRRITMEMQSSDHGGWPSGELSHM